MLNYRFPPTSAGATRATLGIGLIALFTQPATAQTFFPSNATINFVVNGSAITGYANQSDYASRVKGTNPIIQLVTGGSIGGTSLADLSVFNGSTLSVSGGSVSDSVFAYDSSSVSLGGGTIGNFLYAQDRSTVSVSSGTITKYLGVSNSATVNVSGGLIGAGLSAQDSASVKITGGSFGSSNGVNFIDFTAGGFTFVGAGLSAAPTGTSFYGGTDYRLTGVLQDGESVTGDIVEVGGPAALFTLAAAPEPPQSAVLAVGVLCLAGMMWQVRRRC